MDLPSPRLVAASRKPLDELHSGQSTIGRWQLPALPRGKTYDPQRLHFEPLGPHVTVLDAKDGTILGTIDIGGEPEQSVLDAKGHLFIDIEDKDALAVVDTRP